MENAKNTVVEYLKKLYISTVWTHKIQEKESDRLRNIDIFFKSCGIIFLALSASGIFSIIFISNRTLTIATTIVAFLSLVVNLITMSCDFKGLSTAHKQSALIFLALRNKIEAVLTDIDASRFSREDILTQKDICADEYIRACQSSLSTSNIAVERARKALYGNKDNTYTQDEEENLLPPHLRGVK